MRDNRLYGLSLGVYAFFVACITAPPAFADEQEDNNAAMSKRVAYLEDQLKTRQLEERIAQAEANAASAISGSKSKKATDEATAKYADVTALQTVLGDTKDIGVDGTISFNSGDVAVMLQSRQGGILAARAAADELCRALRSNKALPLAIKGKPIVPVSEQRLEQIVNAKLRNLRFNELFKAIEEASLHPVTVTSGSKPSLIKGLPRGEQRLFSTPLISGLAIAQHVVSAVDNLAGVARVNKTYSLQTTAREDLFESRLSTCSGVMDPRSLKRRADRERLSTSLAAYYKKLQKMQAFVATVVAERRNFDALPKASQRDATNVAIKARELLAARVNAITATEEGVVSDLALVSMEAAISDNPILTYSLAIQDTQIKKDRFLLNDKLTYQGTAEVVYQVTGADGVILDGDAISMTSDAYDVASTFSVKALSTDTDKH